MSSWTCSESPLSWSCGGVGRQTVRQTSALVSRCQAAYPIDLVCQQLQLVMQSCSLPLPLGALWWWTKKSQQTYTSLLPLQHTCT